MSPLSGAIASTRTGAREKSDFSHQGWRSLDPCEQRRLRLTPESSLPLLGVRLDENPKWFFPEGVVKILAKILCSW